MPKITIDTDLTDYPYKHFFAVGLESPLYGFLELYGEDGPDIYYVWLVFGKMEGLCCGLADGVQKAIERGWGVYAFNSHDDVVKDISQMNHETSESEIISLYYCALTLAEHYHGAETSEYRIICGEFSKYYRSIGNVKIADDFAEMAKENKSTTGSEIDL